MATPLYREEQRFRNVLALLLVGAGLLTAAYGLLSAILDAKYTSALIYGGILAVLGGLCWFLWQLRLKVTVSEKSIKYKMTPLHGKSRKIKWKEIDSCTVVRTPTLAPNHKNSVGLGGERRFSLTGRNGLHITTRSGERYFIGCRDVEALRDSISKAVG